MREKKSSCWRSCKMRLNVCSRNSFGRMLAVVKRDNNVLAEKLSKNGPQK